MTWNYHFDFYCIYIVVGVVVINVYMEFQWFWEMHILILFFWVEVIWRLCKIFFIKICWYRDVDERRMIRSYLIWNYWIMLIIQVVIYLGIVAMILINNCQKVFISSSSDINFVIGPLIWIFLRSWISSWWKFAYESDLIFSIPVQYIISKE